VKRVVRVKRPLAPYEKLAGALRDAIEDGTVGVEDFCRA
jgi:hypothetical protein